MFHQVRRVVEFDGSFRLQTHYLLSLSNEHHEELGYWSNVAEITICLCDDVHESYVILQVDVFLISWIRYISRQCLCLVVTNAIDIRQA